MRLREAFASALILAKTHFGRNAMFRLNNWIFIGSNAYDEYTFVPWQNRNVYRRTVNLSRICIQ